MRKRLSALAALGLALAALAAAFADTAPQTVSDYANAMNDAAGRIDKRVGERQQAGDAAAAQRLALAASMVRLTAAEFRGAEQSSLTDKAGRLPAPIPERLADAVAVSEGAEVGAAADPAFIDHAHKTLNALLAALPIIPQHPVVFGLLSRDIAAPPLSSDVVIYGFRLIAPDERRRPSILFGRREVPSVTTADRIEVTLPDDIKKAVDFEPSPCESRPSFGVRVMAPYELLRGFWPITWHSAALSTTDLFVLPSPKFYSAKITQRLETKKVGLASIPFQARSQLAIADCGQTDTQNVVVPLPDNLKQVNCKAEWVDTTGAAKTSSRCATQAGELRAVGEITAGAKVCSPDKLCTCSATAQGFVEASGTFEVEQDTDQIDEKDATELLTFPVGGVAERALAPEPGAKLSHLALQFTRRACPAMVDSLEINVGEDPAAQFVGTSKTGFFRAIFQGGSLSVGLTDAFAPDAQKTP